MYRALISSDDVKGVLPSFNLKKAEDNFNLLVNIFNSKAKKIGAKVEINHFWDFLPYTIPQSAFVYKEITRVLQKVGLEPNPTISLGGSDANSLNGRGIESVNIGIGAQNPHANEEFIFIEDLIKSAEIALELVKKD